MDGETLTEHERLMIERREEDRIRDAEEAARFQRLMDGPPTEHERLMARRAAEDAAPAQT